MKACLKTIIAQPILLIALFFASSIPSFSQKGRPFIQHFPSEEIGAAPQYWCAVQDTLGTMYFGNALGVVEFDGSNWRVSQLDNGRTVRSLAYDPTEGRIYAGGQGEFGFFIRDSLGNLEYQSLLKHVPEEDRGFKDVWKTYHRPEGTYFQTWTHLFRWNGVEMDIWKPEGQFHQSFFVNNVYWLKEYGVGLLLMDHDTLHIPKGGKFFANLKIYTMLPYGESKMLVGTREAGFFICDYRNYLDSIMIEPINSPDQEFIISNKLYGGIRLNSGRYLFNTTVSGIFFLDAKGNISQSFDDHSGLVIDNVKACFEDRDGSIWLATGSGVSRIDLNDPVTYLGEIEKLGERVEAINIFNEELLAGTGRGIYRFKEGNFEMIDGLEGQAWDLEKVDHKGQSTLLVSNQSGIFQYKGSSITKITDHSAFSLEHSKAHPGHVLARDLILKNENGDWKVAYQFEDMVGDVLTNTEDCNANLWYSTRAHGIYQIGAHDFNTAAYRIHHYDTSKGLPDLLNPRVYVWNCRILAWTTNGIYRFDQDDHHFHYDSALNEKLTINNGVLMSLAVDDKKGLWAYSQNMEAGETEMRRALINQEGKTIVERITALKKSHTLFLNNLHQEDSIYWISSPSGMVRFDFGKFKRFETGKGFPTSIEWLPIDVENQSKIIDDFSSGMKLRTLKMNLALPREFQLPPIEKQVIPYVLNSAIFDFTSIYFKNHEKLMYRYRLVGKEDEWSDWSSDNSKTYFNLPEGDYELQLEARNVYGALGKPVQLKFEVLPPWYRTIPAFIGYVLFFALSLFVASRISAIRLRRQKKTLEKLVHERTKEIREQKDEIETKNIELEQQKEEILTTAENLRSANESIAEQNSIIEKKNLDITDSIQYAKYIQEAMLPQMEDIRNSLNESFVLFKPKDIVSGDFFWFGENENVKIVAAVDCTGHGVPGAFMSMLGSTLLQQVIFEKGITEAGKILEGLNEGVRESLSQQDSQNRDGMDMALCVIDKKGKTFEFAGAKNPLVYVNASEGIQTIKGDKFPIGGFQIEGKVNYVTHKIKVEEPTSIFLFSDGYQDQFGGPKGKKYMIRQLKDNFSEIWQKPGFDQLAYLEKKFNDWKGRQEQLDDILVIGFRLGV